MGQWNPWTVSLLVSVNFWGDLQALGHGFSRKDEEYVST